MKEMEDSGETLPYRAVSPHPNYVTSKGLALIDAELQRLGQALTAAGDARDARAPIERDLRYWRSRRATAEVIAPIGDTNEVHFGSSVTIVRDDGREQTWRIVGEDEADPSKGTLPYVAPLARALVGKRVGDMVDVAGGRAEIVRIESLDLCV